MISRSHSNLPIFLMKPPYTCSTDDTVVYIFEGVGRGTENFRLVSNKSKKTAGVKLLYSFEDSNLIKVIEVKLTFTFAVVGTCAPLFVSVTGLSE